MNRPKPYAVLAGMTTLHEPHQGWYYATDNDQGDRDIHGPFSTRHEAEEDIDEEESCAEEQTLEYFNRYIAGDR